MTYRLFSMIIITKLIIMIITHVNIFYSKSVYTSSAIIFKQFVLDYLYAQITKLDSSFQIASKIQISRLRVDIICKKQRLE